MGRYEEVEVLDHSPTVDCQRPGGEWRAGVGAKERMKEE
jgi:hypothetical protein